MSRTTSLKYLLGALCVPFLATSVFAATLVSQPAFHSTDTGKDHGVYSVTDQALGGSDPNAAIAFDNFTIGSAYNLSSIDWTGIYAEPLPGALSETDFIISIWGDAAGAPDVANPTVLSWSLDGGPAGTSGPDVTVILRPGDISPTTSTTPGGGQGYDYSAAVSGTLSAGTYWISIQADQRFDNVTPIVDPEWQWHVGDGPDDGFYLEDLAINQELVRTIDLDLAVTINGSVVPEPSSMLLGMFGFLTLGMLRRKR